MNLDELAGDVGEWLRGEGPFSDVVISSRIRLARNVSEFPFLTKASESQKRQLYRLIADRVSDVLPESETLLIDVDGAEDLDRQLLVERHMISRQHAESSGTRGVVITRGERQAIMINEEDHLRIQFLRSGLQIAGLFEEAAELDDRIEEQIEYAYNDRWGYLTACPTNVGTGLRVSVMLHLPALKLTNQIENMFRAAKDMKLAVRGLYGEGTDAIGDFFQVSNQVTLGKSEEEIVEDFGSTIIPKIVGYEMAAREALVSERSDMLDDKIWRAMATLGHARTMSGEESLFLLSHVRMGVSLGRFDHIDLPKVNEMFIRTQSAHLQKLQGERLNGEKRSVIRADYLRSQLGLQN